ncbi:phosphatase PAP2 family protein [Vibrio sp. JC009]|uniref:phosphatase PAP2 family protein n=1 Tax=Vibrio sp. JC009 TaxID=2912314 RepID=UPI0023B1D59B|nr:phosphatase PAP2 family protein [Vibrio sp. JC009]WED22161.1 phosphatase PAP2 family protein [Vibrio sp. JC009]
MMRIEPIARFDLAFSLFCLQHKFNSEVARISKAVSHTGDGHLYLVIGLLAWWLEPVIGGIFLMTGLMAFAIELPIYWVAKNSFRRRRPEELSNQLTSYITPSDRYSLPSGHTAAAFVMATLIGHFFPDAYVTAIVWAALIGSARILLGVHFLTDVVIGAALGIGSAIAAISLIGA